MIINKPIEYPKILSKNAKKIISGVQYYFKKKLKFF